ncbi:hypothetical protein K6W60_28665, partial [Burkholderia cepacia]|uniref:hypothetical protein n=1 Tax=Burkholderia cepacia TaxID=292 RepID=UPI001C96BF70
NAAGAEQRTAAPESLTPPATRRVDAVNVCGFSRGRARQGRARSMHRDIVIDAHNARSGFSIQSKYAKREIFVFKNLHLCIESILGNCAN